MVSRLAVVSWLAVASLTACGDGDYCADLSEQCARCPTTGSDSLAIVAGASCNNVVESGDQDTCQDLLLLDYYASFGCK